MWKGKVASMGVTIEKDPSARAYVLRLSGEIDHANVPEIREMLEEIVDAGCFHVIFDLEHVSYLDSAALGLIVWLDHRIAPCDGRLILVGANKDVSRILELAGLIDVAPTISARETVEVALTGLKPSKPSSVLHWSESMLLPAQAESLARVRGAICDLLSSVEMGPSALFDVKVAVGEALANAVRHGSPGGERDQVRIDVSAYEDHVTIQVRDKGTGFDAEGDESDGDYLFAAGGRGVLFMKALMDRVEFSRDATTGGTVVTLEKRLRVKENSS